MFPLSEGSSLQESLQSLIKTSVSSLSVIGYIGRFNREVFSTYFPHNVLRQLVPIKNQSVIYGVFHRALKTLHLVLVSIQDGDLLVTSASHAQLHEVYLDGYDALIESTFLILNSSHYAYLIDDVPRLVCFMYIRSWLFYSYIYRIHVYKCRYRSYIYIRTCMCIY